MRYHKIGAVVRQTQTVEFWIAHGFFGGAGPHDCSASCAGETIVSLTNSGPFGYTHYTMDIAATSTSTDLHFQFSNSPDYWFLDDVCVTASGGGGTPTPSPTPTGSPTCPPGTSGPLWYNGDFNGVNGLANRSEEPRVRKEVR